MPSTPRVALRALLLVVLMPLWSSTSAEVPAGQTPAVDVDLELMTWPEVKHALDAGRVTALVCNGGTEQRGPQDVIGGHTLVAREVCARVARRLGDALVAPALPYSPNHATPRWPGTIGVTPAIYAELNRQVAGQLLANGFRNVVLMGEHGDGQATLAEVARSLNSTHAPRGRHVVFAGDVYAKAGTRIDAWLVANGYPRSGHGGIADTSTLLYLGGDRGWVRAPLLATARPGDNGLTGDARRASPEIGKRVVDMKVDLAAAEIRRLLPKGNAR